DAADDVGAAAWTERDDDADGALRPVLCLRRRRQRQQPDGSHPQSRFAHIVFLSSAAPARWTIRAGLPSLAERPPFPAVDGRGRDREVAMTAAGAPKLDEILIQSEAMPWREKSLKGVHEKMLWRNEETGASIALIKFDQGAGIQQPHHHASNQFMF